MTWLILLLVVACTALIVREVRKVREAILDRVSAEVQRVDEHVRLVAQDVLTLRQGVVSLDVALKAAHSVLEERLSELTAQRQAEPQLDGVTPDRPGAEEPEDAEARKRREPPLTLWNM